jgi:hypothetical protein
MNDDKFPRITLEDEPAEFTIFRQASGRHTARQHSMAQARRQPGAVGQGGGRECAAAAPAEAGWQMTTIPLPEPGVKLYVEKSGKITTECLNLYAEDQMTAHELAGYRRGLEEAAKEFDHRNNGIGFYEPHEPAEIIRELIKG